jgi:hypothetical protein
MEDSLEKTEQLTRWDSVAPSAPAGAALMLATAGTSRSASKRRKAKRPVNGDAFGDSGNLAP